MGCPSRWQPTSLTLDAAAGWLALYVAAKLIDDLQDGDDSILGGDVPPAAVTNVALALIFASQRCVAGHPGEGNSSERARLQGVISEACLQIVAGQQMTILPDADGDPLRMSWHVARAKAGIPLSLACRLGSMSVGAAGDVVEGLARYGGCIGDAMQAMDDASGVVRRELSDLASRTGSLAVAYGFSVAEGDDRALLETLWRRLKRGDVQVAEQVWRVLENMGCLRYLSIAATRRTLEARRILARLGGRLRPEGKVKLLGVAEWVDPTARHPDSTWAHLGHHE